MELKLGGNNHRGRAKAEERLWLKRNSKYQVRKTRGKKYYRGDGEDGEGVGEIKVIKRTVTECGQQTVTSFFFFLNIIYFYLYKYTVAVFRHTPEEGTVSRYRWL